MEKIIASLINDFNSTETAVDCSIRVLLHGKILLMLEYSSYLVNTQQELYLSDFNEEIQISIPLSLVVDQQLLEYAGDKTYSFMLNNGINFLITLYP